MPECRNPLREELKAYLDNELPALRRGAVARHVEQCRSCKDDLAALQQLSRTLASLPAPEPLSPALRARILAQLPQSAASVAPLRPFWRRPGPLAGGGSLLAMACALLFWARMPAQDRAGNPLREETLSLSAGAIRPQPAAAAPSASKAAEPVVTPVPPAMVMPQPILKRRSREREQPPATDQAVDSFRAFSGATFGARGGGGGFAGGASFEGNGPSTLVPLSLTVPKGKREEVLAELRRQVKEQSGKEPEATPGKALSERRLVFTLPAEKVAAFRALLEKHGKLSEPDGFATKKDMSVPLSPLQTLVITLSEENPP